MREILKVEDTENTENFKKQFWKTKFEYKKLTK